MPASKKPPHDRGHLLWTAEEGPSRLLLSSIDRWTSALLMDDAIDSPLFDNGREVEGNILKLSDQGKWNLSITTFSWREKEASDVDAADNSASIKKNELLIPFYFDAGRHELIASVPVKYDISGSVTAQQYLQRGVAMVVGDDCKL